MTPERFEEIKQHLQYAEDGDPLKDYEDVENLVYEIWNAYITLRDTQGESK